MEFFTAFLAAIMFYVLSKQLVVWLVQKKGWKKPLAAILVIFISFFIILMPISLLATMMYKKALLAANDIQGSVINPLKHLDSVIHERFHISLISAKTIEQASTFITGFLGSLLNEGFSFVGAITMMYFFLYFLIVNVNRVEAAIIYYLPFKRSKIMIFGAELKAQTLSNAVGVPLVAITQGGVAYIAYLIAGLDQAGFWAVITGIASIIPIIGTGLVWIPISIYLLAMDQTWQGIFMLGWGLIVISSLDNLVRFMLAMKMADVHPIVTVLGIIIGIRYFGITGLVFGPLLISYFIILLRIYYNEYQKPPVVTKMRKLPSVQQYFSNPFSNFKKRTPHQ